jgi:hypothetical protein
MAVCRQNLICEVNGVATNTIVRYRTRPAKRVHHRAKFTIPLGPVVGMFPMGAEIVGNFTSPSYPTLAEKGRRTGQTVINGLSGYDPLEQRWRWDRFYANGVPIYAGLFLHWLAGKLGINRMIARAGIPVIRI